MPSNPNEMKKILKELHDSFLGRLPEKVSAIGQFLEQAVARPGDDEPMVSLLNAVHKLHGSAGSYGVHNIGNIAGEWEHELRTIRESKKPPDAPAILKMQNFLRDIKAALEMTREPGIAQPLRPPVMTREKMAEDNKAFDKKASILLVEDDSDLRDLLCSTLNAFGLAIKSAPDVSAALELFKANRFNLVITDFNLPDANARILVKAVREDDVDIPVILVSGKINKKELGDMIAESVDVFLEKPIEMDRLFSSVKRLLHVGDERKKAKKRGEVLLGISSKLALGMKKDALLGMLAQAVSEVTPFKSCAIYILDTAGNILERAAGHDNSADEMSASLPFDKTRETYESGFKYEIASFIPAGLENYGPDSGEESYSQMKSRKHPWSSGDQVLVAVRSVRKLWGFLAVGGPGDGLRPSHDSMRMFCLIANQIANILENSETYDNQILLNSQLGVVNEVVRAALSTLDLDVVQRIITSAAVNQFGHSFACFLEKTPGGEYVINHAAGKTKADLPAGGLINSRNEVDLLRKIEVSVQPLHLKNSQGKMSIAGRGKVCSSLAVPIQTKGAICHILLIEDDFLPEFTDDQINAYAAMASQIELIWSRALYQKYLEKTGNELQESYQKLKDSNELNLKLQNIVKRYVPASTWQIVLQTTDEAQLQTMENVPDMPVMFVDISGFSILAEVASPDTIVNLLNIYFTMVSGIISQYDGEVIKYIGDGLMAYFKKRGNAILAANDILNAKNRLNQELTRIGSVEVDLHIGAACGPAILCHVGPFYHLDRTLLGDTVNTAARLEDVALPGTALFDMRLLPEGSRPEDHGLVKIGSLELRGKSKSVEVLTFKRNRHVYMEQEASDSTYLIVNKR